MRLEEGLSEGLVEGILAAAGYRLRLAQVISDQEHPEQLVLWVAPSSEGVEVEVYGYPELYAFGSDEEDAVDHLAELLGLARVQLDELQLGADGSADEQQNESVRSADSLMRRLSSMRDLLDRLFGRRQNGN
jgi:hypothetical protein